MFLGRRQFVQGALAAGGLGLVAPAKAIVMAGIHPPRPEDVKLADAIIKRLPTRDYMEIMRALANLDKSEPWSVPHVPDNKREPFNRRWKYYANPLLVHIWREMGLAYTNDCQSFCGVTLGWAMQRDGRSPPRHCERSQKYLDWGEPVTSPRPGDIAVYTHRNKPESGHVGIFMAHEGTSSIRVLGANQEMSTHTTCGSGYNANVIDERPMTALKTPELYLHSFRRPPARV